jgi:predicted Zn-dependent peptidase
VLTERMEHVRSVAMGVWMRAGSRHEVPELNGISHFVEHMVFKGTKSRSAQRIAREVDAIGGNLDAFTGKETVCFNIKVLDEHVQTALDVLSDLVLNPVFAAEEITRERGVILEEIKMDEDNPDTLVHEIFMQNFWKGHPLGKPILGTRETVRSFEQNTLVRFFEQRFQSGNMVFSAAGNIEHDSFVEQVARHFSSLAPGSVLSDSATPTVTPRIHLRNKKSLEQVQLCLGVPAPPIGDESRYTTLLLNTILGGGMSSRLFQTVREERGLVYAIYSDLAPYRDTGSLCVYAGARPPADVLGPLLLARRDHRRGQPRHRPRPPAPGQRPPPARPPRPDLPRQPRPPQTNPRRPRLLTANSQEPRHPSSSRRPRRTQGFSLGSSLAH